MTQIPPERVPTVVSIVLFHQGANPPSDAEGYCRRILGAHYGGSEPTVLGWRMIGRNDRPTARSAGDLYSDHVSKGQIPDYGHWTDTIECEGPDGHHVVALVFWHESAEKPHGPLHAPGRTLDTPLNTTATPAPAAMNMPPGEPVPTADAYWDRAIAAAEAGEDGAALAAFQRAIEINPDYYVSVIQPASARANACWRRAVDQYVDRKDTEANTTGAKTADIHCAFCGKDPGTQWHYDFESISFSGIIGE
jgi:hypothetical protein